MDDLANGAIPDNSVSSLYTVNLEDKTITQKFTKEQEVNSGYVSSTFIYDNQYLLTTNAGVGGPTATETATSYVEIYDIINSEVIFEMSYPEQGYRGYILNMDQFVGMTQQ